ncbi:cytochrome b/b6 domain-containing protein [Cohaesibacter intestini]|uniref:cytochrome b/b6 domain-containing protein n=1 Tax=Cohaesibacter intestini TaxID=2211145 RepID=UPI000DEBF7E8|nr:cytochrome b/b6 domain-containing protein [Cohaesibacter intestini]
MYATLRSLARTGHQIVIGSLLLLGALGIMVPDALAQSGADAQKSATNGAVSQPIQGLEPIAVDKDTPNAKCTSCHGVAGFAVPTGADGATEKRQLSLNAEAFHSSAHGEQLCVSCHTDIKALPHRKELDRAVDCVTCHTDVHEKTQAAIKAKEQGIDGDTIANVVKQIDFYMASIHAAPNKSDPSKPNATCIDCHTAHYVYPMESKEGETYRLTTPNVCGRCHDKQLSQFTDSVHGVAVMRFGNKDAAVCADCHTAHQISDAEKDPAKLLITQNCGSCHDDAYMSYRHTYHGQVVSLGETQTAKCFDCHESHTVRAVSDVRSKVHPDNKLKTCKQCHEDAPDGFASFHAHGNTHDFEKYPYMWIAQKFMIFLLVKVFFLFWLHSALWFYREWKDKKEVKKRLLVNGDQLVEVPRPEPKEKDPLAGKHVRRFKRWEIWAHGILAVAVIMMVMTGTTLLYAESAWAPYMIKLLGGVKVAGIIHRVCATAFAIVFFGHIFYAFINVLFIKKDFKWFGPYSLLPRWQDAKDIWAMGKWFFGKGPRPVFDHWTYWEKFDYWAPFWGMFIIGISGAMLWFHNITAAYLPGWVFNIATIVHGEEAFLAAVFLFTVHYFNCHWRPDKIPQDIVIWTGTMPLEEFKHERTVEYDRLVASGELDKYIVEAPSKRMTFWSKVLGMFLIVVSVILLVLVIWGFFEVIVFD